MSTAPETPSRPPRIVVVEAGISDPSSTKMLADRITDALHIQNLSAEITAVRLGPLAVDIARAVTTGFPTGELADAARDVSRADAVVIATPVYKAGMSGVMKSFLDILDDDALTGTPVLLAATAGTVRHSLVIDQQIRPVLTYFRTLQAPTAIFQAPDDWADTSLPGRITRAARELLTLTTLPRTDIAEASGDGSGFPGRVDFGSDLMRLATGGH